MFARRDRAFRLRAAAHASWKDTALVLLALVYSGNLTVGRVFPREPQLVLLALFFGFLLIRRTRRILSFDFQVVASIFAAILLVQCVGFSFYPFVTIAGFFVRLFIGYALMRLVPEFPRIFVRVMVSLALLSFAFYVPYLLLSLAGVSVEGIITRAAEMLGTASIARRPLFLHTFLGEFSPRNSGMFWEPGAFAGYLILTLILLALVKDDLSRTQYRRGFCILTAALFTTMSTAGYIAFALIPLLHYDWRAAERSRRYVRVLLGAYIAVPLLLGGAFYAYRTLPFLKEKIDLQIEEAKYQNREKWYQGRVGTLVFDWRYIQRRPLTGWGLNAVTRHALDPWMEVDEGMGNGMSDFTAKFGVTGMLLWLVCVFRGMMVLTKRNLPASLMVMLVICLVLQGEIFLDHPLFLGLAFLLRPERSLLQQRSAMKQGNGCPVL